MSIEMKIPAVGESITEVTLSKWIKNNGDYVQMDEIIAELESDKATFELTAEKAGVLITKASEGDTIAIGSVVCAIDDKAAAPVIAVKSAPLAEKAIATPSPIAEIKKSNNEATYASGHPSPAAAKILSEKGIDAQSVKGSGIDGRITKEDAQAANRSEIKSAAVTTVQGSRTMRAEKMSSLRKTVAKRLVAVKNDTAMLTTFNEVDMQAIMDIRAKYKDKFKEKYGVGLGFMSFFTKAVCEALQAFPAVNAQINGEEIIYHNYADISIAVSAPKGLVVPIIKNAESLTIAGIEKAVAELAIKARENKLTLEEMTGGTFTITNGGVFGSMMSTPIINAPQSAILGMHNIVERPVAINGQVVIRPMMYVALSYDHRIIDGRESVGFLVRVKQLLEDPERMLLGV
jgi:2-oxoglutarate dehydrogenase E2 component (dihydrolipoamide succinyltransferase)